MCLHVSYNTNGVDSLGLGSTGMVGYIVDGLMADPLYISEEGQTGLTGFNYGKSLIGVLNEAAKKLYWSSILLDTGIGYNAGTAAIGNIDLMDKAFLRADEAGSGFMPSPTLGIEGNTQIMGDLLVGYTYAVDSNYFLVNVEAGTNPQIILHRSLAASDDFLSLQVWYNRSEINTNKVELTLNSSTCNLKANNTGFSVTLSGNTITLNPSVGVTIPAAAAYRVGSSIGVSGSFLSNDGKTVTVTKGIITGIV